MADKVEKVKLNIWIEKTLVDKIDKICKKEDCSKSNVVRDALNEYFDKENKEQIRYEVITAKLDSLDAKTSSLESKSEAQATLLMDAIKNQPIAVQNQLEEPKKSWWKRMFGGED